MDEPVAKRLRQITANLQENQLNLASSASRNRECSGKKVHCICGKQRKDKLTSCDGPECAWNPIHLKCVKIENCGLKFCSELCKNDHDRAFFTNVPPNLKNLQKFSECKKQRCQNPCYHSECRNIITEASTKKLCPDCKRIYKTAKTKKSKKSVTFANGNNKQEPDENVAWPLVMSASLVKRPPPSKRHILAGSLQSLPRRYVRESLW